MYKPIDLGISWKDEIEKTSVGLVKSYPREKIADQKRKIETKNPIGSSCE